MIESQQPAQIDDEPDLRELFRALWAGKWLIAGVTFAAVVIAVLIALSIPNVYRAQALLAPNDDESSGGLSALAAQYGGLAGLAGINIGGGSTDKISLGLETIRSRRFIAEFVEHRDILVPLLAATGWDAESGELEIDSGAYDVATGEWVRDVSPGKSATPSSQEAYKAFRDVLSVSQNRKSGLVTISIDHYSPEVAKEWVDWLVEDINSSIMRHDVAVAEQAIEYLEGQIESTSVAALQSIFFRLIEDKTKTVLLARVSDEYLLRTLDPAVVPEERLKPNRSLIVILGMMLGGLSGIAITVVLNRLKQ